MAGFRRRRLLAWAGLIALGGGLSACDRAAGDPSTPQEGRWTLVSNAGGYRVRFEASPHPIPLNRLFDLNVRVESLRPGSSGAPGPGLDLEVDARMPAHFHGMNRVPKLIRLADGSFRVEGMLFHMPGRWELYFDITQDGRTERAQQEVELK